MSDTTWLLTDCFDTVLVRKISPDSVKRKWAKIVSTDLCFVVSNQEIYEIRRSAERCLQIRCENGEFRGEELFSQIIKRIAITRNLDLSEERLNQLVGRMIEAEYQAEIDSLQVNMSLLTQLQEKNKQMAVVSDYHMNGEFLKRIFHRFEIDSIFQHFFTSSDARCNKHTGELYGYVLRELGIQGQQAEMYGDTQVSDVDHAEAYGIVSTLITPPKVLKSETVEDVMKQLKNVLVQDRYGVDSFANYGASLYLMIDRLYRQCVSKEIDHIYFLAREGELLKQLFDRYVEKRGGAFSSHYLYVSRRATVLSNLKLLDKEDFSAAGSIFNNQSLRYFLNTIGFSAAECDKIGARFGFDISSPIKQFSNSRELHLLRMDSEFAQAYNEKVRVHQNRFERYLNQENFFEAEKVALVDVGWNGTIQDNIAAFKKESQKIFGYYCGLVSGAVPSVESQKCGLLFSDVYGRSKDYDIWSFDNTSFERILTASHAATIGYEDSGDLVEPCLKKYESEMESYEIIKPVQTRIRTVFDRIDDILNSSSYSAEDVYIFFEETHIRTMLELGIRKAKFQQKLYSNQVENFYIGSTTKEINRNIFGMRQIIRKALPRIKLLKNTEIMIKICAQNNLYFLIPFFTKSKKTKWLKRIYSCG